MERAPSPGPTGRRYWLYERAEQMLWAIGSAVHSQRRSLLLLPDVLLGQVVWGGCRGGWPRDWRGNLFRILGSLT